MSNYIKFKGKCSKEITGLLICELPPIQKPKMRTSVIKIDGRDGDIVDKLGYESYTRAITIGLTRNYNVDEITNFFNGSGDMILSNEPDKVYKAEILDAISYERLIRFRKAKVNVRFQPYKTLLDEPPFILNVTDQTSFKVANKGYETSKPIITLYGSGDVSLSINGLDSFNINIDDEFVVIDSIKEDAYKNNISKNRMMTGAFPILQSGINTISWVGNVTKIIVEPKSRWL